VNVALVERRDNHNCAVIVLNRPEKLNALSKELIRALTDEFQKISRDIQGGKDIRSAILQSATEKAFCVGADLSERLAMNEAQVVETLNALKQMTVALEDIPVPTIAILRGVAFGGGFELALACDLRVAHDEASLGLTETGLAIIPGAGGTQRLTQLVGVAKAKEMIFLGIKISAEEAKAYGVVNEVSDTPEEVAEEWADQMALKGPLALRAAKQAINANVMGRCTEAALGIERENYLKVLHSKDRLEGLKAFVEKRSPHYRGE
jgi:methylglutaconyl-CoA hydratase